VTEAPPGYLELLRRNASFRRLWLGTVASFFGDWFTTIALYAIVQELSSSATAVAGVLIAKTLPIFVVSPIAGRIVDSFDRRKVLITTDLLRAVLTIGLVGAYFIGSLPLLYAVEVVRVAVAGVFIPGRSAAVPQVVTRDELGAAMALSGGTWSVMLALGAAAGGVVTELLGPVGALGIDALTFLLSAAFLWGLPALPPRHEGEAVASARLADALRWLRGRYKLTATLLLKAGSAMAAGTIMALPLFGNGVFALSASAGFVGLLYTGRGLGALTGSLGLRRGLGDATCTLERIIPWLFLWQTLCYLLLSQAPSVWVAAAAYFLGGIGGAGVWVSSSTLAQRALPRALRGRLFAMEFGLMTLLSSIASYSGGQAIDRLGAGPRDVVWVSALLLVVPAVLWWGVRWVEPEPLVTVEA